MRWDLGLMAVVLLGEIILGWHPEADRTTWFLENVPVFIGLPVLVLLQPRWKLTTLTLAVLTFHAFVLMCGGYYTYAKVPAGFWIQEVCGFARNHYDRLGHFMQGFGPALAARELLIKKSPLKRGFLLSLIVVSMCLAFSAFYELIEWWSAVILGQGADAFLGTQGDPWDTQWDMCWALIGSLIAVIAIAPIQDRFLRRQGV